MECGNVLVFVICACIDDEHFSVNYRAHMGAVIMNLLGLIQILALYTSTVFGQCEYQQVMDVDVHYYIFNQEYPRNYNREDNCRWIAISPHSSRIVMSCSDVNIPNTDSLKVAARGYAPMEWGGNLPRYQLFDSDQINITLTPAYNTHGGKFQCEITALTDPSHTTTTPTPTPSPTPIPTQPPNNCDCGWRQVNRIVGGEETGVNEFPFMAGLVDLVRRIIWCGCTIIADRFVVTAGHCIANANASQFGVIVGEHNVETSDTPYTRLHLIDSYLVHELFVDGTSPNDIALIRTATTIEFNIAVGPVCLPFTLWVTDGTYDVTELGWGTTEFSGMTSDALQKVNLTTLTNPQCEYVNQQTIAPSQICTYGEGKDSCQFDSGGPAVWFDPTRQRYKLVGLISNGRGCASRSAGVCTRVQSFTNWIQYHTGVTYCHK